MAGIFTRTPIKAILSDETLTPEDKLDQIFALYGKATAGYISKGDHEAELKEAIENTKKDIPAPIKATETEEYRKLLAENNRIKTLQADDFAIIKPQYREMVYDMLNHDDGHKKYAEQIGEVKDKYAEMFVEEKAEPEEPQKPQFGAETGGEIPTGNDKSFSDFWGFKR